MNASYAYDAPNSIRVLSRDSLFEGDVDFGTCVIERQCKLTDLVSSAPFPPWGLFVSARLRSLLQSFTLPTHRSYRLRVSHGGRETPDYYWLHLPQPDLPVPDDSTVPEAEDPIRAHQDLTDCDLLSLCVPSRFAYTYVSAPLVARMMTDGITGVRLVRHDCFEPPGNNSVHRR